MPASQDTSHSQSLQRLQAMGLTASLLPGGRAVVATLPLGRAPFDGSDGPRHLTSLRFATVGANHIKCLEPACFFQLPLISIAACGSPSSIEARIRSAWRARLQGLRRVRATLAAIGVSPREEACGAVLAFPIEPGQPGSLARVTEPGKVILPGRGALSGIALGRAEDRLYRPDLPLHQEKSSGSDLEISISNRLEELAREDSLRAERRRARAPSIEPARPADGSGHRVLLVGPKLGVPHTPLAESLRVRGYRVTSARSADEVLNTFTKLSHELVIADTRLGRDEGVELIPALGALAGVESVPIVLVDDHPREQHRELARRIGAVGYLIHPIDPSRVVRGIAKLVESPARRRYSRYERRLPVRCGPAEQGGFTTSIGRLGMLLCTGLDRPLHTVDRYEIAIPEIGSTLDVEAEAVYRIPEPESTPPGLGLRFLSFSDGGEALLIQYLASVETLQGVEADALS